MCCTGYSFSFVKPISLGGTDVETLSSCNEEIGSGLISECLLYGSTEQESRQLESEHTNVLEVGGLLWSVHAAGPTSQVEQAGAARAGAGTT